MVMPQNTEKFPMHHLVTITCNIRFPYANFLGVEKKIVIFFLSCKHKCKLIFVFLGYFGIHRKTTFLKTYRTGALVNRLDTLLT